MRRLPWRKYQDFYLRLGFLKALVACIGPHRRSATNDSIERRLRRPLFESVDRFPALADRCRELDPGGWSREHAAGRSPLVVEALLVTGDCPSWLYAITEKTLHKILEWAHAAEILGRGNQLSERGIVLEGLAPDDRPNEFFAGDPSAWNPFLISNEQRALFFYHLAEMDEVMVELIRDVGTREPETIMDARAAGVATCRAMLKVLDRSRPHLPPQLVPEFRTAHDLALVIARELGLEDELARWPSSSARRLPKPIKVKNKRGSIFGSSSARSAPRQTTKNADHQAIPRFEQLVDLAFLTKDNASEDDDVGNVPQRRWRYRPTDRCRRWAQILSNIQENEVPFKWSGFAAAYAEGEGTRVQHASAAETIDLLWDAYSMTRRSVGHTPADSVSLVAMIRASERGLVLEQADVHRLLLRLKRDNLLPNHAFFASGNDLDRMFILLRPGFAEHAKQLAHGTGFAEAHQ